MHLVTYSNIDMLTVNKLQKSSITRGGAKAGQNPLPFLLKSPMFSVIGDFLQKTSIGFKLWGFFDTILHPFLYPSIPLKTF